MLFYNKKSRTPSLLSVCTVLLFSFLAKDVNGHVQPDENGYIIEFSTENERTLFLNENQGNIMRLRYHFDSDILTGLAVEFKSDKVAKQLLRNPEIINSWPIHHHVRQHAPINFDNILDQVTNVTENTDDVKTTRFNPQNKDTIPLLTSVYNISQSLKTKGDGIKIGIIDTGVDYTHPALGGCFGQGCKVTYGYDLVGNDYNGSPNSIKESNDPIDNCPANSTSATGHGTFVSGIIGAEDKTYDWTGVAPGATLGMWKVYGCNYSGASNDVLLKAMEMAYKADMDVINISLGVSGGWEEEILAVMADRLVSQGVNVVVASGNIGSSGMFLTAAPASGGNVIAVGSTMNSHIPGYVIKISSQNDDLDIVYRTDINLALSLDEELPVVNVGKEFNSESDACSTLSKNKLDDTIALMYQGGCNLVEKLKNAKEAGAKAALVYTNTVNATTSFVSITNNNILPVAFINNDDGKTIFDLSKTSNMVMGQFTNTLVAMDAPASNIDAIGDFSTLGPTNELQLKPELVAVGGNVFSTLPTYLKSYGFESGTSFSTPVISGAVALLLSELDEKPKPEQVKELLMNFAKPVRPPISALHYGDSPIRQGAGVIDVAQSVLGYEQFGVSPAKLSFNDTDNFNSEGQTITIENREGNDLTVHVSHAPSLTATGYNLQLTSNKTTLEANTYKAFTPVQPIGLYSQNNSVATLNFSESTIVVPAGKSVEVRVQVQPPTDTFSEDSHALYGGFISVKSENTEASIPYIGMIGNMKDLPILDRSTKPCPAAPYPFPSIGFETGAILDDDKEGNFNLKFNNQTNTTTGGAYVLARLLTGTPILQIQVIDDKSGEVIGDVPIDATRTWMIRNTLSVTESTTAYSSWMWPGNYISKDITLTGSNGNEDPKYVEDGTYRLKLRALHVYGDRSNNDDWDEWTSPKLIMKTDVIS